MAGDNSLIHGKNTTAGRMPLTCDTQGRMAVTSQASAVRVSVTPIARPANVTAYSAGDMVVANAGGHAVAEDVVAAAGDGGYITRVVLYTSQTGCTARFRLWFFSAALSTPPVDNGAFLSSIDVDLDRYNIIGYVDLPVGNTANPGTFSLNLDARLQFVTAGVPDLYLVLEAVDAFTPESGQTFVIDLGIERG